jgi:CubicO group peptidase (beta-lactamase class C family)
VDIRDSVRRVLEQAVADSAFPGAIAVVGTRDRVLVEYAAGRIDTAADAPPPDTRTLWDLASLTKVVATTSAMMQLVESGRVSLDAPVQRYLPRWNGPDKERVTVRQLLTHSSGLPAFEQYFRQVADPGAASRDTMLALVFRTPLDSSAAAPMVYSDVGAILLGEIVEAVSGERIDRYAERHVFDILGMHDTRFLPVGRHDATLARLAARAAPTEVDPWRGRHLRGEVHDENAYAMGGVAGHAGLFSTAHDLTRFAQALHDGGRLGTSRVFRAETVSAFTARADGRGSSRALGWDTPTGDNSAGHFMSSHAFGHTGFTGTSLWVDPANDVFVILLSNRVNPTRDNQRIAAVRIALADAVMQALLPRSATAAAPSDASLSDAPSTRAAP